MNKWCDDRKICVFSGKCSCIEKKVCICIGASCHVIFIEFIKFYIYCTKHKNTLTFKTLFCVFIIFSLSYFLGDNIKYQARSNLKTFGAWNKSIPPYDNYKCEMPLQESKINKILEHSSNLSSWNPCDQIYQHPTMRGAEEQWSQFFLHTL